MSTATMPAGFWYRKQRALTCTLLLSQVAQRMRTITHCLGLCHETMASAVCLSIFLCIKLGSDFFVITCQTIYPLASRLINWLLGIIILSFQVQNPCIIYMKHMTRPWWYWHNVTIHRNPVQISWYVLHTGGMAAQLGSQLLSMK